MIDNELYCSIVITALPIIELLLRGCCFFRLIIPFMRRKEKAWLVWIAYSLMMLLLYIMPYSVGIYLAMGIGMCTAFLMMCWVDRRNYRQKVFLTVTFYSLCWLAAAIAEILYDNLYNYAENTDYMAEHINQWFALYVIMCIVYLVSEFVILFVSIWCILKVYVYKSVDMTKKELYVLSTPLFTSAEGYKIMVYYRSFYIWKNGKNTDIYDILTLLYYMISIIVVVVIIGLYQSIKAKQEEKLENELLAAQVDSIRQHIEQVESLYQNIRSIKHDMTNHVLTLERLYARNKAEEAKAYGEDLKAALSQITGEIKSGNPVTDVILQELKNEAENKKIHFHSDFYYPKDTTINAFDVSVILNNALQNAIENIQEGEGAYISILSYHRNNAYMIEICNSFMGNLQWNEESGLPITSKKKIDGHGYGLANIRRVARKYSGDIAIDVKDGEFQLSIMLMME